MSTSISDVVVREEASIFYLSIDYISLTDLTVLLTD
jgi:hypothetical protein